MEPVVAPLVTKISLRLCDLICVVWESVVYTTAVDIKLLAKVLHGDT